MVEDHQSGLACLAADPLSVAGPRLSSASTLTSPLKTRIGGFRACPSGRPSRRGRRGHAIATGSRPCAYQTASGRRKWPSRDPLGEEAGHNIFGFVNNSPLTSIDPLGRQIAPGIGDFPKPSGNGIRASRLLWSATPCGNNLKTSFIQVIVGAPRFLGRWIVDDGTHGLRSEEPTCPPLYPASHNNLYEDYPNVFGSLEDPLLHSSTFIVCRVCLERCCWPGEERWRIVSVGPCASFAYPGGEEDVVDISDRVSDEVPWSFKLAVEDYYPSVLKGDCFHCQSSKL